MQIHACRPDLHGTWPPPSPLALRATLQGTWTSSLSHRTSSSSAISLTGAAWGARCGTQQDKRPFRASQVESRESSMPGGKWQATNPRLSLLSHPPSYSASPPSLVLPGVTRRGLCVRRDETRDAEGHCRLLVREEPRLQAWTFHEGPFIMM
jgi:hypothetical protein